ncbi:MAG TPA: hypothetical protein VNA17_01810 [Pyrinomonadaceae bacterium]|nr:hypothetical protein [Pyrinomonadaceae bacterium]
MKNSLNLCIIIMLLVVLGCSCPGRLIDLGKTSDPESSRPAGTPAANTAAPTTAKGEYDVTLAKFEKITNGMKRSEVESIFGGKGTEFYSGKGGGSTFISVKYVGDNYKTVFVSYRNDKVTSKSQAGL